MYYGKEFCGKATFVRSTLPPDEVCVGDACSRRLGCHVVANLMRIQADRTTAFLGQSEPLKYRLQTIRVPAQKGTYLLLTKEGNEQWAVPLFFVPLISEANEECLMQRKPGSIGPLRDTSNGLLAISFAVPLQMVLQRASAVDRVLRSRVSSTLDAVWQYHRSNAQ